MRTLAELLTEQHAYEGASRVLWDVTSLVNSMPSAQPSDPVETLPDAIICLSPFEVAGRSVIAGSLQDFLR